MKTRISQRFIVFGGLLLLSMAAIGQTTVNTTVTSGSLTPLVGFNMGDTIDIVATLSTSDVNENGEGEPLVLQSSTGFSGVVSAYAQPLTFSFKASSAGVLNGFIQGFDGDESATVTVTINSTQKKRFTQAQKDALAKASAQLNTQAGAEAAIAAICALGLIPNPSTPLAAICTGTAGVLSGTTWFLSGSLNQLALDPSDPNFTIIAQPMFASVTLLAVPPGATQEETNAINAFNALVLNEVRAAAFAQAIQTSVNRAQGAADAGNTFWEQQQVNAINTYIGQLSSLLGSEGTLLSGLQTALVAANFPSAVITPDTVLNFEFSVLFSGLPDSILQTLNQLGASPAQIDQIRQIAIVQDINAASGTFQQLLTNPSVLQALHDLTAVLGLQVSISVKGQDDAPINPNSNGKIPVAVLSTSTFNAVSRVDVASLTFGHTGTENSLSSCDQGGEDVNGDGLPDLVCHFTTQQTDLVPGDTVVFLRGKTTDGVAIQGQATIQTVPSN